MTTREVILHGEPCDCTLHDIGPNCWRGLPRVDLDREAGDLVRSALRSGINSTDIVQAFMVAVERNCPCAASPDGIERYLVRKAETIDEAGREAVAAFASHLRSRARETIEWAERIERSLAWEEKA